MPLHTKHNTDTWDVCEPGHEACDHMMAAHDGDHMMAATC